MTSIFPGPVPQFEFPAVYGIRIQVFPTEPDAQVVIERAADSAGSPNLATVEVIARLNLRVNVTHEDVLPNDGLRRHYRARHEHPDFTASANTGWVNAKPAILFAGSDRQDVSPFFFVSGDDPSSATQTWNEVNEHRIGEQGTFAPFAKLVAQGDDLAGGDAWLELRQWVGPSGPGGSFILQSTAGGVGNPRGQFKSGTDIIAEMHNDAFKGLQMKSGYLFRALGASVEVHRVDLGSSGGGVNTIDLSRGNSFRFLLTGNPTINLITAHAGNWYQLELKQDATGGRTVTWDANIINTPAQPDATANLVTVYRFYSIDGTKFYSETFVSGLADA